jgi:hypothetical protein
VLHESGISRIGNSDNGNDDSGHGDNDGDNDGNRIELDESHIELYITHCTPLLVKSRILYVEMIRARAWQSHVTPLNMNA